MALQALHTHIYLVSDWWFRSTLLDNYILHFQEQFSLLPPHICFFIRCMSNLLRTSNITLYPDHKNYFQDIQYISHPSQKVYPQDTFHIFGLQGWQPNYPYTPDISTPLDSIPHQHYTECTKPHYHKAYAPSTHIFNSDGCKLPPLSTQHPCSRSDHCLTFSLKGMGYMCSLPKSTGSWMDRQRIYCLLRGELVEGIEHRSFQSCRWNLEGRIGILRRFGSRTEVWSRWDSFSRWRRVFLEGRHIYTLLCIMWILVHLCMECIFSGFSRRIHPQGS